MGEQDYFRDALSDFAYEAASGGAIRHLADLGYTAKQISDSLTYPTPYERVRRTMWQHLVDTRTILTSEPGAGGQRTKAAYSVRHDRFGRASFCMEKAADAKESAAISLREMRYSEETCGPLAACLEERCSAAGEENAYASFDFGLSAGRKDGSLEAQLQALNARQREYVEGLMWENRICYHRLDGRMREIVVRLYDRGLYHGYCYFLARREKLAVG